MIDWHSDHSVALHAAFRGGNEQEFGRLLKEHPEYLCYEDGEDKWARWAVGDAKLPQIPLLQALLNAGFDINTPLCLSGGNPDDDMYLPEGAIFLACARGRYELVKWMLDHGAKINFIVRGRQRCEPLLAAVREGHLDVVKLLVEHGAVINPTWGWMTPVQEADDYGQFHIRDYLRSLGGKHICEITPPTYSAAHRAIIQALVNERGPVSVWKMELPGNPTIVLRTVPSNKQWRDRTVFTVGLSDRNLPQGRRMFGAAELRLTLPGDCPFDDAAFQDPQWNWPLEWLQRIAAKLREGSNWPEDPVLFMNGDPPEALAPNTQHTGWICLRSLDSGIDLPDYRSVEFHDIHPIYTEEAELARRSGHEELVERFQNRNIEVFVDPQRENVAL